MSWAGRMEEALEEWLYSSGNESAESLDKSSLTISDFARPRSPWQKAAPAA